MVYTTIEVEGLGFKKGHFSLRVDRITLGSGLVTGIIGKNGSGKSTLLKLIAGSMKPSSGIITIDGTQVHDFTPRNLSRKMSFVQQEIYEPLGFTVREVLSVSGYSRQHSSDDMMDALRALEIERLIDRKFSELSGGERRLVTLAGTMYQDAEIMLMDEPTTFLDVDKQLIVERMIEGMKKEGKTVVLVMHDLETIHRLSDQLVMLKDGCVVDHGPPTRIMNGENLKRTFGVDFEIYETPGGKGFRGKRKEKEVVLT